MAMAAVFAVTVLVVVTTGGISEVDCGSSGSGKGEGKGKLSDGSRGGRKGKG
jgi:hypothetical protein